MPGRLALDTSAWRAGTPIPKNDIWIAACTVEANAQLLTFDADFGRVRRLERIILKA